MRMMRSARGQSMIEYLMIAGIITAAILALSPAIGSRASEIIGTAIGKIPTP